VSKVTFRTMKRSRRWPCDVSREPMTYYVYVTNGISTNGEPFHDLGSALERVCANLAIGENVTVFVSQYKRLFSGEAFKMLYLH